MILVANLEESTLTLLYCIPTALIFIREVDMFPDN